MSQLIQWNLITLDGYFEGDAPWELPWHEQVWGPELNQFSIEQLATADGLVFGRKTYEGMAAYWPTATGEIADYMNALPKVVCSRTLESADWNNTTLFRDDLPARFARLKEAGDGNLFVFGSADLSLTLMQAGLFDEYRVCLMPVLAGKGRLLFPRDIPAQGLHLRETRSVSTGAVILFYEVKV